MLKVKYLLALLAMLIAGAAEAQGATTTLSIVINSPASTSVTCPLGTYTAPVAAGSTICAISIAPSGWSGAIALSGTNASSFALSGTNLNVGATPLGVGTYSVTLTVTP